MTAASTLVTYAYRESNLIAVGGSPTTAESTEGLAVLNAYLVSLFGNELGEQLYEWPVPQPQRTAGTAADYPLTPAALDLPTSVYLYPPANVRIMSAVTSATTVYFPEAPCDGARMGYVNLNATAALTLDGNGKLINTATTNKAGSTITVTIATPGVITWTGHGLIAGSTFQLTTTGALPTGLSASTTYYVISTGLATDSFSFAATAGGSAINTTGTQSGTHTGWAFTSGTTWLYRSDTGNWVPLTTLVAADQSPLPQEFDDLLVIGTNIRLCSRQGTSPSATSVQYYNTLLNKLKARYRQNVKQLGGALPSTLSGGYYDAYNLLSTT